MVEKGVGWNTGRVFLRDAQLYSFDLLEQAGHQRPAFINLQQYYVEGYLLDRARALDNLEIRWKHRVAGVAADGAGVTLTIDTAGRSVSPARRLPGRRRRRAQPGAQGSRP